METGFIVNHFGRGPLDFPFWTPSLSSGMFFCTSLWKVHLSIYSKKQLASSLQDVLYKYFCRVRILVDPAWPPLWNFHWSQEILKS